MIRRIACLLLAAALSACSSGQPPIPAPPAAPIAAALAPAQCQVGPNGAIPVADRGIGGTGIKVADRGIGGTGAPTTEIVGSPTTGIVGVITGFASICLAGEDVQYDPATPVLIDGRPATQADLRAGQVAAIGATGLRPYAQSIAIRHEVSGPVDVNDGLLPDGIVQIAGQRVLPPPFMAATAGQWLSVSGFRREDGVIVATRLDPRSPGGILVRGIMRAESGRLWIGNLEIHPGPGQLVPPGTPVLAIGRDTNGILDGDTLQPDELLLDPSAYFGGAHVLLIEAYAEGGSFGFGRARYNAPFARGFGILRLERGPGGRFAPVSIRPYEHDRFGPAFRSSSAPSEPRTAFTPAPTPRDGFGPSARSFGPAFDRANGGPGGLRGGFTPSGGFGGSGRGPR